MACRPDGVKQGSPGKGALRAWARTVRAGLDWDDLGAAVRSGLAAWLDTVPATTVLGYLALPDEPSLGDLPERSGHRWAVTRTPDGRTGVLDLHPWDAPRERHRLGFEQPVAGSPTVDAAAIGVVLVPGLAFDRRGARLGRGLGFYDRLLPNLAAGTVRVGVAVEAVVVDEVPTEAHDVAVHLLATEAGVRAVP